MQIKKAAFHTVEAAWDVLRDFWLYCHSVTSSLALVRHVFACLGLRNRRNPSLPFSSLPSASLFLWFTFTFIAEWRFYGKCLNGPARKPANSLLMPRTAATTATRYATSDKQDEWANASWHHEEDLCYLWSQMQGAGWPLLTVTICAFWQSMSPHRKLLGSSRPSLRNESRQESRLCFRRMFFLNRYWRGRV